MIPIKTTYERPHVLTAPNAAVAQTIVGIDDLKRMEIAQTHNVLHMFTTGTFVHAPKSTTCAFHT